MRSLLKPRVWHNAVRKASLCTAWEAAPACPWHQRSLYANASRLAHAHAPSSFTASRTGARTAPACHSHEPAGCRRIVCAAQAARASPSPSDAPGPEANTQSSTETQPQRLARSGATRQGPDSRPRPTRSRQGPASSKTSNRGLASTARTSEATSAPSTTAAATQQPEQSQSSTGPGSVTQAPDPELLRLAQRAAAADATVTDHEAFFKATVAALQVSPSQVQQLECYLDYMLETNKVMNLTAVRVRHEALTRHLADSLALLPVIDTHTANIISNSINNTLRVIDVGTGAGLPGMVLAIARPQWRVTLLDSLRKRCDFLKRAAELAGLTNVDVVWSRAEDGARKAELREQHDLAVARAVADTRVLAELCLPYVRKGGLWIAAKGASPQAEVSEASRAISLLGGSPPLIECVTSYSADGQRTAVVVNKHKATPNTYPRKAGTPNKTPL